MRSLVVVLLALSLFPASAQAQKSQPDYLSIFSVAARHYFGGPAGALPPCGQPKFEWHSNTEMGMDRAADANPSTCVIRFVKEDWDRSSPADLGFTVMHEWGHLYVRPGGFGVIDTRVDASQHGPDLPLMRATYDGWESIPQLRAMLRWKNVCVAEDGTIYCGYRPRLISTTRGVKS